MLFLYLLYLEVELLVMQVAEVGSLHYLHRRINLWLRTRDTIELESLQSYASHIHFVDNRTILVSGQVELISILS